MYAFVSGKLVEKTDQSLIINNNGMGYEVFASNNTLSNIGNVGENILVHTYLHVREDAFLLFGFANNEEKKMFLDLITVSGIGAKTALGVLSGLSVSTLITAIVSGDVKTISTAKGIGKKTAERIILELKGKFGDLASINMFNADSSVMVTDAFGEAIEVLVSMGLQRVDALELVKKVAVSGDTTESIIQKSLKNMN